LVKCCFLESSASQTHGYKRKVRGPGREAEEMI